MTPTPRTTAERKRDTLAMLESEAALWLTGMEGPAELTERHVMRDGHWLVVNAALKESRRPGPLVDQLLLGNNPHG